MNLPEIPQKAKDYFWLLAMMLAFAVISAVVNRIAGTPGVVPLPPTTTQVQVSPVVVSQSPDGSISAYSLPLKDGK